LPVNFNLLSGPATLTSNQLTLTGTGTIVVSAFQAGNSNFVPALSITNAFTVTTPVPPSITMQPGNLLLGAGEDASFTITSTGTGPLAYQWQCNGTNLPGTTGAALNLTNVQISNAGVYKVFITGPGGTASATALLTVGTILGVIQHSNQMTFTWSGPWALQTSTNVNGPYADLSGAASPFTNIIGTEPKRFFRLRSSATNSISPVSFAGGQFSLGGTGVPGYNYVIEASTNLANWIAIATNPVPFQFTDIYASNYPARFYRTQVTR
jgi:hypothetical protein